jgi:hypothetical protein
MLISNPLKKLYKNSYEKGYQHESVGIMYYSPFRARIFKRLWSPGIDSKE